MPRCTYFAHESFCLYCVKQMVLAALAVWLAFLAWAPYNLVLKVQKRSPCSLTFFLFTPHILYLAIFIDGDDKENGLDHVHCRLEVMEGESIVFSLLEKSFCF